MTDSFAQERQGYLTSFMIAQFHFCKRNTTNFSSFNAKNSGNMSKDEVEQFTNCLYKYQDAHERYIQVEQAEQEHQNFVPLLIKQTPPPIEGIDDPDNMPPPNVYTKWLLLFKLYNTKFLVNSHYYFNIFINAKLGARVNRSIGFQRPARPGRHPRQRQRGELPQEVGTFQPSPRFRPADAWGKALSAWT